MYFLRPEAQASTTHTQAALTRLAADPQGMSDYRADAYKLSAVDVAVLE